MDKVEVGISPEKKAADTSRFISLPDFEKCLKFLQRSRLRVISLLGGEPTLHPDFLGILDLLKRNGFFTHIRLFTNGLFSDSVLEYLAAFEGPELRLAVNVNHPSDYLPGQWERVEKTLEVLGPKMVGVGYNIYHRDNDFDFLMDLFLKYRLKPHVRLGLTQPIMGVNNRHLPIEDFSAVAGEIVAIAERFTRHKLFFSFDCGFPFCMFTLSQHQKLLSCAIHFRSLCSPIIDIGPDLTIWRCFPLSRLKNRHLDEFETRMDAEFYYQNLLSNYRQFGIYPQCSDCDYKREDLCCGGCLSRVLREFHGGLIETENTASQIKDAG